MTPEVNSWMRMTWVQVIIWTIFIVIFLNHSHHHHPHHHLQIQCPTQECTWRLFCRSDWPPVPSKLHYFFGCWTANNYLSYWKTEVIKIAKKATSPYHGRGGEINTNWGPCWSNQHWSSCLKYNPTCIQMLPVWRRRMSPERPKV